MCTYVETPDVRILLDAGVSLCPKRFGLPPHPREFQAIERAREEIAGVAKKVDVVTISHYHNDHHTPSLEDWLCNWTSQNMTAQQVYAGKIVLMKNPRELINSSQRERALMFQRATGRHARKMEFADGRAFAFGETRLRFHEPVFHGPTNSGLGWVLISSITYDNEKLLFAPDVQGPIVYATLKTIIEEAPQMLIIGGPPTYLEGLKVSEGEIHQALRNLIAITERIPETVLEHHLLRDRHWHEKIAEVYSEADRTGHTIQTGAEYMGQKNCLMEAMRKDLFDAEPPSREFRAWMRLSEDARKLTKPPLEEA